MMPSYMLAKNTIGKTVFTRDPNPVVVDAYYQSMQQMKHVKLSLN